MRRLPCATRAQGVVPSVAQATIERLQAELKELGARFSSLTAASADTASNSESLSNKLRVTEALMLEETREKEMYKAELQVSTSLLSAFHLRPDGLGGTGGLYVPQASVRVVKSWRSRREQGTAPPTGLVCVAGPCAPLLSSLYAASGSGSCLPSRNRWNGNPGSGLGLRLGVG